MERMWRQLACWSWVLVLSGCAFAEAIDRGDGYATVGDWEAAQEAYEEAVRENPDNAIAIQKLEEARQYGADAEVEEGRDALAAGRWAAALEHVELAQGFVTGDAGAARLRADTLAEMIRSGTALLGSGSTLRAYELGLEARTLFPSEAAPDELVKRSREALLVQARAELDAERFESGVAVIEDVLRREPSQHRALQPLQTEFADRWSASLRKRAEAAERSGGKGSAFVLYAMASAVAGQASDRAARDRLRAVLREQGRVSVALTVEGAAERRRESEASLQAWVVEEGGLTPATRAGKADIVVGVGFGEVRCESASVERVGSVQYVSGTRQVRNPEFERRRRDLIEAEDALEREERKELEQLESLGRLEHDLDRAYARDWDRLNRGVEQAEAEVARAQEVLDREEDALEKLQDAREAARREGRDVTSLSSDARRAADNTDRARRSVREARGRLGEQMKALRGFRVSVERVQADVDRCREGLSRARREVLDARRGVSRSHRALLDVPPLVDEDIVSDFRYPIFDWTRTCASEVSTSVSFEGRPGRAGVRRVAATTSDSANDAHVKRGIRQDPLRFPMDDLSLTAALDRKVVAEVQQVIREALERRGRERLSEATAKLGTAREEGLTLMVVHALAAVDAGLADVAPTLKAELGLKDVRVLVAP